VEFLATHPPTFTEASEPLEADSWLHTVETKFDLLNCTENQKTLYAAQQLLGDARAWWASFTATRPANQVQWAEFRDSLSCAAYPGRHHEKQAPRVHGSAARQPITVCLLQDV
jgi:hypothetical protein